MRCCDGHQLDRSSQTLWLGFCCGHSWYAAKCLLVQLLPLAARDRDAKALIVIHGFHAGTVLRDMVRKELKSPFIKERRPGITDGQTILVLNKKKQGPYL